MTWTVIYDFYREETDMNKNQIKVQESVEYRHKQLYMSVGKWYVQKVQTWSVLYERWKQTWTDMNNYIQVLETDMNSHIWVQETLYFTNLNMEYHVMCVQVV